MTKPEEQKGSQPHSHFVYKLDRSSAMVVIGIIMLFATAVIVTLVAPRYVDSTWTSPSSPYQVQMYEVVDPHFYISSVSTGGSNLQYVHHLKQGYTLLAFKESDYLHLLAAPELEKYITHQEDPQLKLTSRLLMLREPQGELRAKGENLLKNLEEKSKARQALSKQKELEKKQEVLELYDPQVQEAFSFDPSGGIVQDWTENFSILDEEVKQPYHKNYGLIYVQNPREFRIAMTDVGGEVLWRYDPQGHPVDNLAQLKSSSLGFYSRRELIDLGEQIYAVEGCWYCHTDQTRTLIEDVVLNGSDNFPAPPSSANEFIYQKITFPGTRRIGPDLSRIGVKRASREWNIAHFWAPKVAVPGSIMPAFKHFFVDPHGTTDDGSMGIPNHHFEAIYQYLMTKGTRITPPNQAWWLGKDPINTKEIIEGQKKLP